MVKTKIQKKLSETLGKVANKTANLKIKQKFQELTKDMPEEMRKRIGSALILVPVVLFFIYVSVAMFSLLVLTIVICMTYEWIEIIKKADEQLFWKSMGILYILAPSFSLLVLRNMPNGADIILWLFMVVWATDVAAYFVGTNLKGPKLAPSISPNKTWSGLAGGIASSMLIGLVASLMFKESAMFFIAFSGILAVIAQIGDLLESKVKRIFDIKDSGTLIPGHGGILDRIDGLTFTAPLVMIIAVLSKGVF